MIDDEARERIRQFIGKGKEECKLAYAGELGDLAERRLLCRPAYLCRCRSHGTRSPRKRYLGRCWRSFGPAISTTLSKSPTARDYALTGGLYSRSPEHIARIKREFRVGNLYINRRITGALVDRQPFGGFKLSGIGTKAGGPDYLQQFLLTRTITENTLRRGFAPQGASGLHWRRVTVRTWQ